jgi:hypothetical protein
VLVARLSSEVTKLSYDRHLLFTNRFTECGPPRARPPSSHNLPSRAPLACRGRPAPALHRPHHRVRPPARAPAQQPHSPAERHLRAEVGRHLLFTDCFAECAPPTRAQQPRSAQQSAGCMQRAPTTPMLACRHAQLSSPHRGAVRPDVSTRVGGRLSRSAHMRTSLKLCAWRRYHARNRARAELTCVELTVAEAPRASVAQIRAETQVVEVA